MKKVLYLGPAFYNYELVIKNLIEKYLEYEVIFIDISNFKYEYKNIVERLYNNIFYKKYYKNNLKNDKISDLIIEEVKKLDLNKVDIILFIRPMGLHKKLLKFLYSLNKKMICHQWDSINSLEGIENYFHYFNKVSSFDPEDAKKYNIKFIPNFYIEEKNIKNQDCEYDAYTVMTYDNRIFLLEKLAKELKKLNKKYLFLVYSKDKSIRSDFVTIINKPISLEENNENIEKSKTIIEIGHQGKQGGLTFRAIDSIGKEKKLITNYDFIKNYDFYNSNNIFIIQNENIKISNEFFNKEYEKLPVEIYAKYSGENWIKEVFREE